MQRLSKRRLATAVGLMVVSAVGIASRVFHSGNLLIDKYLGDAVYAAVFYLFLGIIWDRATPAVKVVLTLVFVMAVELFQLTLIPQQMSLSVSWFLRFASILLGTQFSSLDIVAYLVGILGVWLLDNRWIR